MNKKIEIPFGAKDSELKGWEYTIPEGMEAVIKDGKIIVREQESEDERIRKVITEIVEQSNIIGLHGISREKMFAWLEKQKEQKPIFRVGDYVRNIKNGDKVIIEQLDIAIKRYCYVSHDGVAEIHSDFPFSKQDEWEVIGHIELKPAEWSDNFEENIRNLLHEKLAWTSDDGSMYSAVFIDDKTLKDIISGIWFYVGKEALKYPDKQLNVEQKPVEIAPNQFDGITYGMQGYSTDKPAEWSEEDEKMFESFMHKLEVCDLLSNKEIRWAKLRLKSLRPQPNTVSVENATKFGELEYERGVKDGIQSEKSRQWKPSENQMKLLDVAIAAALDNNKSSNLASGLITLRKDLEKLM